MRVLLALIVLLACAPSFADVPRCSIREGVGFTWKLYPAGSTPAQAASNSGAFLISGWWCVGKYSAHWWAYSVPVSKLPADAPQLAAKALSATLPEILAAEVQYMTAGPFSPEMAATASALMETTRPPAPVWLVAPNGTYTTRPMYAVVNGVRSTTALKTRATVGAVCSCATLAIEEGDATFCPLLAALPEAGKVTKCKK
jgi:hypothetical protein